MRGILRGTWRRVRSLAPMVVAPALVACVACTPSVVPPAATTDDVILGGVTLHVRSSGPRDGPPVILLHGFPETGAAWEGVADDLAVDHRVVVPDLRGAGRSSFAPARSDGSGSDDYDKRSLAGDLAALADRLGLPPATVVGHDMGAMTAVAWARARPDQVASLVLTGGGVPGFGLLEQGPPHLRAFAAVPPGDAARRFAGRERAFLDEFVRAGGGPAGSPTTARLVDDAVRAYTPPGRLDAAFGQYRALVRDGRDNRDDRFGPAVLPMPVLVIATGVPDLTATTVEGLAPHRRLALIPGAGHFVPTERPRETAAAIRDAERPE